MKSLKVCTYNLENLFLIMDRAPHPLPQDLSALDETTWQSYTSSLTHRNKPLHQLREIAHVITTINADIYGLTEVGGPESLHLFNQHFLGNRYHVMSTRGNSPRGIDLGYLVAPHLAPHCHLHSHRHRPLANDESGSPPHFFSRDVLQLKVSPPGQTPLTFFLVHLKSYLDAASNDPHKGRDHWGMNKRRAEVLTLAQLIKEVADPHYVLMGDFNGMAGREKTSQEFLPIYQTLECEDVLEILQKPKNERFTHVGFPSPHRANTNQLDFIFLPPAMRSCLQNDGAEVYRYRTEQGELWDIPKKRLQRQQLPTDHYPLFANLNWPELRI